MPGAGMPNFRRNGALMAKHGIYDLRQHLDEVVMPVLRYWQIFERNDFTSEGLRRREELAVFIARMEAEASKFADSKARYLEREERRAGNGHSRGARQLSRR